LHTCASCSVSSFPTRRSSDLARSLYRVLREFDEEDVETIYSESFAVQGMGKAIVNRLEKAAGHLRISAAAVVKQQRYRRITFVRSEEHTSELQSRFDLVCRLL